MRALAGDLRQLASVRRIVLDDGPERGVRALAFSTGGGLDFWVLADRSLDVGPTWWRGVPVAWASPAGFRAPALHDPEGDGGRGFERSFSGLLVTCGLDHVRQPRAGHPLHGRLPFTPARVTAYGEDWERGRPVLFCEGEVVQARHGGENLRLRRRIEAAIGGGSIRIEDTVANDAAEPWPQALLYHINLGYPAIRTGSAVRLGGETLLGPVLLPDPADRPTSASYPVDHARRARCALETPSRDGGFALEVAFATDGLPHLQLWHDLRPGTGIVAIEPCTSARGEDGRSLGERPLGPGERRRYEVELGFSGALDGVDPSSGAA